MSSISNLVGGPRTPRRILGATSSTLLLTLCAVLSLGADFCGHSMQGFEGLAGKQSRYLFSVKVAPEDYAQAMHGIPALAAGGAEIVISTSRLASDTPQFVTVRSSDAGVLAATAQGADIQLRSGVAGTAELRLFDGLGQMLDSVDISVKSTTLIKRVSLNSALLLEGGLAQEQLQTFAGDRPTFSRGALAFTLAGTLAAASPALSAKAPSDLSSTAVWFTGTPGKGTLTASTVEGVSVAAEWTVVTTADVGSVVLGKVDEADSAVYDSHVDARLSAAALSRTGQRISGPSCAWTVSDPAAVILQPKTRSADSEKEVAGVVLPKSGTYLVTCTMGSAASSLMISRL